MLFNTDNGGFTKEEWVRLVKEDWYTLVKCRTHLDVEGGGIMLYHHEHGGITKEELIRLVKEEGYTVFKCRAHLDFGGGEEVSYYGTVICSHTDKPEPLFRDAVSHANRFSKTEHSSYSVYIDKDYGVNDIEKAISSYEVDVDNLFSTLHSSEYDN